TSSMIESWASARHACRSTIRGLEDLLQIPIAATRVPLRAESALHEWARGLAPATAMRAAQRGFGIAPQILAALLVEAVQANVIERGDGELARNLERAAAFLA